MRKATKNYRHRSTMKHDFGTNPPPSLQRSTFDRTCTYKTTFDSSFLIPVYLDEVLPGDTVTMQNVAAFCRLATPLKPIMDNLHLDVQWWFVPMRQLWDNWERFQGEQDAPGDSTDFLIPVNNFAEPIGVGSIADYLGLPAGQQPVGVSALPIRCYRWIFNSWYRDENLTSRVALSTGDGPDTIDDTNANVFRRGKRKDYFTSCLPWPQKGDSPLVPLGEFADVVGAGAFGSPSDSFIRMTNASGSVTTGIEEGLGVNVAFSSSIGPDGTNAYWPEGGAPLGTGLATDLANAQAATINEWRQAFQLQKILERDARGGTRYPEILKAHFGVNDPQLLVLQRPMYLGGHSQPVNIAPVPQTSETNPDGDPNVETPQANLAAVGTVAMSSRGFRQSFTEHGYIMGLASVRADLTYQQGVDRKFLRQTRYDFFMPALAHLGEQAVTSKEIWVDGTAADEEVFGYQERWAEYRYARNQITGLFRSDAPASLDVWHLSQDFATRPLLNNIFIREEVPLDRCIAVPEEPHFICDFQFQQTWARPMPTRSIPGFIDHF